VVYALGELGARVAISNRTRARAERVARDLGATLGTVDDVYDLLVNATPLGMQPDVQTTPVAAEQLRAGALIFDTVYRPLETRLLREARTRGCETVDGLHMLVHQAVEQIRLWSGSTPSAKTLRQAALAALG
jgi:shikimate 5-dehydrogenase